MRLLWSEQYKHLTWRRIWIALAETMETVGLVSHEQVEDLQHQASNINLTRIREIEAEIHHDLVAEIRAYAEQCPLGGEILHWGLTSADVKDNADVLCQKASLRILIAHLKDLLHAFAEKIENYADLTVMGYTHLQPAEPITLGYRLAIYAQDLLMHFESLIRVQECLRGKGFSGAVGTYAPFVELLSRAPIDVESFECEILSRLGLDAFPVKSQTYPRIQDYILLSTLAALAASIHKFAADLRMLQSPQLRTMSEPFGKEQVGSSAMPFKRNPVLAETTCSLSRIIHAFSAVAWENAANNLLERTLDDSANRRTILPEAFLACDEILCTCTDIVSGLAIDEMGIQTSLETYAPFCALERILTAVVREGADRQQIHEHLRKHSLNAWEALRRGEVNPLVERVCTDEILLRYLPRKQIEKFFKIDSYIGLAPKKAKDFVKDLRKRLDLNQ